MAVSDSYIEFIKDQLEEIGEISSRKMFGGAGIYHGDKMFGLIANDRFYLKANEETKGKFEEYGMKAFMSSAKKKGMPYWEVPDEILEDRTKLFEWSTASINLAKN